MVADVLVGVRQDAAADVVANAVAGRRWRPSWKRSYRRRRSWKPWLPTCWLASDSDAAADDVADAVAGDRGGRVGRRILAAEEAAGPWLPTCWLASVTTLPPMWLPMPFPATVEAELEAELSPPKKLRAMVADMLVGFRHDAAADDGCRRRCRRRPKTPSWRPSSRRRRGSEAVVADFWLASETTLPPMSCRRRCRRRGAELEASWRSC